MTNHSYIEICSELIRVFARALETGADPDVDGSLALRESSDLAFEVAKRCGWDYEHDEEFLSWMLRATTAEIFVVGLFRALAATRRRYLECFDLADDARRGPVMQQVISRGRR